MGTMFEKGQTKRYSRVAAFSEGKEVKRKRTVGRKKPDEQLALEADNRKLLSEDVRNRFRDIPGSLKDAGERIMRELKPTIDEVVQSRPAMRKGGKVESKKMMAKEVAFMKKKKAPKSMIAHEEAEMKPTRMAAGGRARPVRARSPEQRRDNRRRVAINRMNRNTAPERPAPKNRQMPSPTELRNMTPAQRQRVMRSAQTASRNQPRAQQRPSVRNALRNMSPEQRRAVRRTTRKTRPMPRPSDPRTSGSKARPMPRPRPGTRPTNPRPGTRPNNSRDPRTGNGSIAGLREGARPKNRRMPTPRPGRNIPKNRQMPTPRPGTRPTNPRPGTRPTNPRPGASRPTTPRGPLAQALAARKQKIAQRQAQQVQVAANREAIAQRQAQRPAQRAQVATNRAAIAQRQVQRQAQRAQVAMNRVRRGQTASVGSNRNPLAGLTLRSPVTTSKAGGAVKTKKYAGGGMIPTASKKSPNSMGTPYSAGGRVKGKAMDGCATKGWTRGRTM